MCFGRLQFWKGKPFFISFDELPNIVNDDDIFVNQEIRSIRAIVSCCLNNPTIRFKGW
jgi:hypothetical protein